MNCSCFHEYLSKNLQALAKLVSLKKSLNILEPNEKIKKLQKIIVTKIKIHGANGQDQRWFLTI